MEPTITRHAAQRACQRLGSRVAEARVRKLWRESARLPDRLAASLLDQRPPSQKGSASYRWCGDVLLVCRGRRVVTLWRLDIDQLATLLVWRLMGVWTGSTP